MLRQYYHDQEVTLPTRHHTQQRGRIQHLRRELYGEGGQVHLVRDDLQRVERGVEGKSFVDCLKVMKVETL